MLGPWTAANPVFGATVRLDRDDLMKSRSRFHASDAPNVAGGPVSCFVRRL